MLNAKLNERSAVKYHHVYNKHKLDNDFFLENMCPLMTYSAM